MHWVRETLSSRRDRIACIEGGRRVSYGDLVDWIDRTAAELRRALGERQGEVVAIRSAGVIEGIAALLAIHSTGQVALPQPDELSAAETAAQTAIAEPAWSLFPDRDTPRVEARSSNRSHPLVEALRSTSRPGLILFSSGTSGQPKGMLHDLESLLARFRGLPSRQDRTLQLLLTHHIGGIDAALRCLFAGSTLVVPEARTPEAAGRAIETHAVNILPASPTFVNLMLLQRIPERFECGTVEIIAYGAEPMPAPLLSRLSEAFPRADLQQKFGTSETGAVRIRSRSRDSLEFRIHETDTEWKVIAGELWLKTPSRILGYLNADEDSLESGGWYRTGDLVEESPEGFLRIVGRQTGWINLGGQKVHPSEIEGVLASLPGVLACKVTARPDPLTGSALDCELTVGEDHDPDPAEWKRRVRNHARGKLPPWKIPSRVRVSHRLGITPRMKRA